MQRSMNETAGMTAVEASLDSLNDRQREAASCGNGPLLIIAGAGTGKTTTLAHRVAYQIATGVDPGRILLLTFTRRAAGEMLRRVDSLLRVRPSVGASSAPPRTSNGSVWGGTFHAIATRLLRLHGRSIGLDPGFTILDRTDAEDLMNFVRTELGLSRRERRFPQKATCFDIYSRCVDTGERLELVLESAFPWCRDHADDLRTLFSGYVDRKADQSVLDYDDLLLFWRGLLRDGVAGAAVRARFDRVLVDEYQDTNALQAEIVSLLRPDGTGVTVVGDDAQSIYSFRAATVRNILDFPSQFADTTVVTLERNYRSTAPLLDVTNRVIAQAGERYEKHLWTDRAQGEPAQLVLCEDEDAQTEFLVETILDHREAGLLLRKAGGALPRVAPQPGSRTRTRPARHPVRQVRRSEVRGDGPRQRPAGLPPSGRESPRSDRGHEGTAARSRHRPRPGPGADGRPRRRRHRPRGAVRRLGERTPARRGGRDLARTGRAADRSDRARPRRPPGTDPSDPRASTPHYSSARTTMPPPGCATSSRSSTSLPATPIEPTSWPRSPSIPPATPAIFAGPPYLDEDYLILSTMHSAKGLEWDAVYVIHAADGNIPSDMATGSPEQIDEELRLFYVALTRAKDWLYVCCPLRYYPVPRRPTDSHGYAQLTRFVSPSVRPWFAERLAGRERVPVPSESSRGTPRR